MTGQVTNGTELPIAIEDTETIVRAIVAPAHYNKGKLATAAFRPPPGQSALSVMRQAMGDDFCKQKGAEIGKGSARQNYVGLVSIKAASIRAAGSTVKDSREVWLGHADLDHGFPSVPANDPGTAAEFKRMTERCQALKKACTFQVDPSPGEDGWKGKPLKL